MFEVMEVQNKIPPTARLHESRKSGTEFLVWTLKTLNYKRISHLMTNKFWPV